MDKNKSTAIKSGSTDKGEAASGSSTNVSTHQRANVQGIQNILLIWLDNNIDESNEDSKNSITQFRRIFDSVKTFTDSDQCIEFIESLNTEKTYMVISGSLGQHIVPLVHDMSQVESIFIFCGDKKYHQQWAKKWSKIKGVFTDIKPICEALQQATQETDQNVVSTSFVPKNDDISTKNLDELDPSFMYTQILKEVLLSINFEQKHINEFTTYCRGVFVDNQKELENVDKLEKQYYRKTPIWWYTCESFLYSMLNRGLRLMDIDIIIKMGFFLSDLHRQITQLHSEQFQGHHSNKIFTVYRGQGTLKEDFEKIAQKKGGLLSFNNFLSANKNREISLKFAQHSMAKPDLVGVVFVMKIDPTVSTVPFAFTHGVSNYSQEDDLLFSMHSVFRINNIKPLDGNQRLFQVDLTLTNDTDKDLCMLTDRTREEISEHSNGWYRLGQLLLKIGHFDKAQEIFAVMQEETTDEPEKANLYNQLGSTKADQGDYEEAITFYEKALAIKQKTLPTNLLDLASSYNSIGSVYGNIGDYEKALSYYEKTLEIRKKTLPANHPDLAVAFNNIGEVYDNMGNYEKALSNYEKSLMIRQQSLPPNHPDLASSYNSIGSLYANMDDYEKALSYHEKSLEIKQKSLPPSHPDLAMAYTNIGEVYDKMGNYSKALSYFEKSLEIQKQTLPPNHPDLASLYSSIGLLYTNMGDYAKALSHYQRAVDIGQISLPPGHPDLQTYKENIDSVKKKL